MTTSYAPSCRWASSPSWFSWVVSMRARCAAPLPRDIGARYARPNGRYLSLARMAVLECPIVERDANLEALRDGWGEAGAGAGRLVLVGGEAGAGKTTLLRAFGQEQPGR